VPTVIEEEFLRFEFNDDWHVIKYDDHVDYVDRIRHLPDTKAVDFTAIYLARTLFLIEVKDFRGHRIKNQGRIKEGQLAVEVAQKVRDTIAGIVAAHHRGNAETWDRFTRCLTNSEPPVRVLLWLEDDLPLGPPGRRQNRVSVMTNALKRHLRWLTTKVLVASIALRPPDGIAVTNLPGAGQRS
jgi:hypothetical protein